MTAHEELMRSGLAKMRRELGAPPPGGVLVPPDLARSILDDALWRATTNESLPPGAIGIKDAGNWWRYPLTEFE